VDVEREHERWSAIELERGYIRARLHLLTHEEGGRLSPIASGYRSCWAFPPDVHDEWHDGPLTIESGPGVWLDPGQETTVRLHPLVPDLWPSISPGLRLTMHEGSRVVGVAEVIEVVPPVA
jgi:translation elongation factor EF-Tu-like GTPase